MLSRNCIIILKNFNILPLTVTKYQEWTIPKLVNKKVHMELCGKQKCVENQNMFNILQFSK